MHKCKVNLANVESCPGLLPTLSTVTNYKNPGQALHTREKQFLQRRKRHIAAVTCCHNIEWKTLASIGANPNVINEMEPLLLAMLPAAHDGRDPCWQGRGGKAGQRRSVMFCEERWRHRPTWCSLPQGSRRGDGPQRPNSWK